MVFNSSDHDSRFERTQIKVTFPMVHEILTKFDEEYLGTGRRSKLIKNTFTINPELDSQGCVRISPPKFNSIFINKKGKVNTRGRTLDRTFDNSKANYANECSMNAALMESVVYKELEYLESSSKILDDFNNDQKKMILQTNENSRYYRLWGKQNIDVIDMIRNHKLQAKNDKVEQLKLYCRELKKKCHKTEKDKQFTFI